MSKYDRLVGNKLKELREYYRIDVEEMSSIVAVPLRSYLNYENGIEPIPKHIVEDIKEFFEAGNEVIYPTLKECKIFWLFRNNEDGIRGVHDGKKYIMKQGNLVIELPNTEVLVNDKTSKELIIE
ncbi:MAG: hypothetical protein PHN69_03075 [Candidatus Pacebacteria bacterium]|nr:hypothetical protein [Candidatus Paceibacterota bacterium]